MNNPVWEDPNFCYGHQEVHEPIENPYLVCGECLHPFGTEKDLVDAYVDGLNEYLMENEDPLVASQVNPATIPGCPVCLHSF